MIGLDTHVLARDFVAEDGADAATKRQRQAARTLIESAQPLFLPKTRALELEWVLRGYHGFLADQVLLVFERLLAHPPAQPQPHHHRSSIGSAALGELVVHPFNASLRPTPPSAPPPLPSGSYTPETLAAYLGVSVSAIYSWNSSGSGPPFVKLGHRVRSTYEDMDLWLARPLELPRG